VPSWLTCAQNIPKGEANYPATQEISYFAQAILTAKDDLECILSYVSASEHAIISELVKVETGHERRPPTVET